MVARRTGGNPLLVVELVQFLGEGEDRARDEGAVVGAGDRDGANAAFPAECRRLLAVAAVVGTRFRLDVLAERRKYTLADVGMSSMGPERGGIVASTSPARAASPTSSYRDTISDPFPRAGTDSSAR